MQCPRIIPEVSVKISFRNAAILMVVPILILSGPLVMTNCSNEAIHEQHLKIDSRGLKRTIITPHMEQEIRPGENVVYCASFQLAWNEVKDSIIKDNVRLEGDPPLVNYLNRSLSDKKNISQNDYLAMAGLVRDSIIQRINDALKETFKNEAPVVEEIGGRPDDVVAYAYLYKNLRFQKEFESLTSPIAFDSNGGITKVNAFGIRKYSMQKHLELEAQVELFYDDNSSFVIKLKPTTSKEEIILSKMHPEKNLLDTVEVVQKRIERGKPDSLQKDDSLAIPKFNFEITHSYSQLLNKPFRNKGFENYFMKKAIQEIFFKLDERGAILKSSASLKMMKSEPRALIFNKPFLIYLKEKGAKYPYFAMWIDNPELMIKK